MKTDMIHVMLADDDEDDRFLFLEAFDELKIKTKVDTFNDGVFLMDYLNKDDAVIPQILFLDLNMPRKTGIECLKEIRNQSRFKDLAIAIYSTSSSEEDIEDTFVCGANVYIKKPSDSNSLDNLSSKIQSLSLDRISIS